MKKVVFVAPYFMDATEKFIGAATTVPDAKIGLVSCDPISKLPRDIRERISAHYAVNDISTAELQRGVKAIGGAFGGIDRIMGMLEQIQVPLGEIREQMGVPGMGAAVANNFRDKAVMKSVLRAAGLPCARHGLAESAESTLYFTDQIGFPLIVKPPDGAGAKGTFRCDDISQLRNYLAHSSPSSVQPVVLEEFITGEEYSFDSVCVNGRLVWSSISHYSPGPLEVVREPWIQWCVMIPRETELPQYQPIRQVAEAALQALGMQTGLSHMEWFLRPDGRVAISEVGARPPGAQFTTLISLAHDFNLYRSWSELMIHDRFQVPERKYAVGAAYLRGMGQGSVSRVHGVKEIAHAFGDFVVEAKIPQPGQSPSGGYEGEGYIIVRHPETQAVEKMLRQIINSVQIELA